MKEPNLFTPSKAVFEVFTVQSRPNVSAKYSMLLIQSLGINEQAINEQAILYNKRPGWLAQESSSNASVASNA